MSTTTMFAVAWGVSERSTTARSPVEQLGDSDAPAVAGDPHQEGRGPVRDQQALEVDFISLEIVCRAGEAGTDCLQEDGYRRRPPDRDTQDLHACAPRIRKEQMWNTVSGSAKPPSLRHRGPCGRVWITGTLPRRDDWPEERQRLSPTAAVRAAPAKPSLWITR